MKDTYYSMPWNEFEELVREYGFEVLSSEKFVDGDYVPTNLVAWHRELKLILHATSICFITRGHEVVNSITTYGVVQWNGKWDMLLGSSSRIKENGTIEFAKECHDAPWIATLNEIRANHVLVTWEGHQTTPYLLPYGEAGKKLDDKKVWADLLIKFPYMKEGLGIK